MIRPPAVLRFGLLLGFFFICLGCSTGSRQDGYLYYRLNADPSTLDPAYVVDVTGGSISAKLYNGLVKLDKRLNVVPDIAERWDRHDGGRILTFFLRKGVRFSNGREVTADDFRYSFKRILAAETRSPNTWVLDRILGAREFMKGEASDVAGIEVRDKYTLRITLTRSFGPFMNLLTMTAAYVIPKEEVDRYGKDFSVHPAGTGPFILNDWRHNTELLLRANDHYFADKAKVRGISYRIIPEDLTAVTEFELGNLDVLAIPVNEFSRFSKSGKWGPFISSARGLNTYYLGFNCSRAPFNNAELRRAVAQAIDIDKIMDTFYEKRGTIARGPVPELLRQWGPPAKSGYNPTASRQTTKGLGAGGKVINLYVNSDQEVLDLAEIIQSYLRASGLDVRIRQLEWSAYKAAINNGEADMFWLSWWADYPDPENFLFPLFHSSNHGPAGNRSRYTNKVVDALIEAGQNASTTEERNLNYMNAEKIITDEAPWVFFWHKTDYTVSSPRLKNYRIFPVYNIDKGTEVSF